MGATSYSAPQHPGSHAVTEADQGPGLAERARIAASAVGAAVIGLAPHLLHHAGPLAGAALFAGVGGSLLFGALGLLAAIPFLVRLRRRHESWRIPAAALALMAAVFSLSTFVIGPAISGTDQSDQAVSSADESPSANPAQESAHEAHH